MSDHQTEPRQALPPEDRLTLLILAIVGALVGFWLWCL